MIGIIAALRPEVSGLIRRLEGVREEREGRARIVTGRIGGREVAVAWGGTGPKRAAAVTRTLIRAKGVRVVVSVGYTGALDPSLGLGDLVIADGAWRTEGIHKETSEWVPCDPEVIRFIDGAARGLGTPTRVGPYATLDRFVHQASRKAALHRELGAVVVEMESAAVGAAAREAGLPWGAVRAVSDVSRGDLPDESFLGAWKRKDFKKGVALALRRPVSTLRMARLIHGAWRARGTLNEMLVALAEGAIETIRT